MLIEIFLLVSALCIDMWIAAIAYGAEQIRIPFRQTIMINGICSGCLGASLLLGTWIDSRISENFTKGICFVSLLLIGLFKLFDSYIRNYLKKHVTLHKNICFSISNLKCILSIYADPVNADADCSKFLSWKESALFAFAMSIDSLIAGTLAAFMKIPIGPTILLAFVIGELFLFLGVIVGQKITKYSKIDLSWLGGALFIFLAFWKII